MHYTNTSTSIECTQTQRVGNSKLVAESALTGEVIKKHKVHTVTYMYALRVMLRILKVTDTHGM